MGKALVPHDWPGSRVAVRHLGFFLCEQGQVTVEYFILFAIVAVLTLIGLSTFDNNVENSVQEFFDAAAAKIAN